jgi:hypothetical protein
MTYSEIKDPESKGGLGDSAYGINDQGEIIGRYSPNIYSYEGFSDIGGDYEEIGGPFASAFTTITGINNQGDIVGDSTSARGFDHGFEDVAGQYQSVSDPQGYDTDPSAINDNGVIVGTYRTSNNSNGVIADHGFEDVGGVFTTLYDPQKQVKESRITPTGVDNNGDIVGYFTNPKDVVEGFLDVGGQYSTIVDPQVHGDTFITGIAPDGHALVGYVENKSHHVTGFIYSDGQFETLTNPAHPNAQIMPFGVNDSGQIVGEENGQGFVMTP